MIELRYRLPTMDSHEWKTIGKFDSEYEARAAGNKIRCLFSDAELLLVKREREDMVSWVVCF